MFNREELYNRLKNESHVLESPELQKAFSEIDRRDFVPEDYKVEAYEDYALPTGFGQTISQPTVVAFMLELLDLKEGESALDVGSGSGWTTALMAKLVGDEGEVLGVEIVPELVRFGRDNIAKYDLKQARIEKAARRINDENEYDEDEQYDKILVSASAEELPDYLIQKLRAGGTIVIPIENSIFKIVKNDDGSLEEEEFPGFVFVPLV